MLIYIVFTMCGYMCVSCVDSCVADRKCVQQLTLDNYMKGGKSCGLSSDALQGLERPFLK